MLANIDSGEKRLGPSAPPSDHPSPSPENDRPQTFPNRHPAIHNYPLGATSAPVFGKDLLCVDGDRPLRSTHTDQVPFAKYARFYIAVNSRIPCQDGRGRPPAGGNRAPDGRGDSPAGGGGAPDGRIPCRNGRGAGRGARGAPRTPARLTGRPGARAHARLHRSHTRSRLKHRRPDRPVRALPRGRQPQPGGPRRKWGQGGFSGAVARAGRGTGKPTLTPFSLVSSLMGSSYPEQGWADWDQRGCDPVARRR